MTPNEMKLLEFDKAHESEDGYIVTEDGVWVVYGDGARRSRLPYGELGACTVEPPLDPKELRKWQIVFWETRLEQLVNQFEDLKARTRTITGDGGRFDGQVATLKDLQSKVRSARSKLSHLTTQERGYTQADVDRAWDVWEQFAAATREESEACNKFNSAFLGKSSPGILEKLKARYDAAKQRSTRAMERWNSFEPAEARSIVNEQLDAQRRAEREHELEQIEV